MKVYMSEESRALELFDLHFPLIAEKTIRCKDVGFNTFVMSLNDGRQFLFDAWECTIRRLPRNSNDISEDECKHELGMRLRHIMLCRGMSEQELSEKTGIHVVVLSRYINGKTTPSFYNIDKIAKALKCSIDDFRCEY